MLRYYRYAISTKQIKKNTNNQSSCQNPTNKCTVYESKQNKADCIKHQWLEYWNMLIFKNIIYAAEKQICVHDSIYSIATILEKENATGKKNDNKVSCLEYIFVLRDSIKIYNFNMLVIALGGIILDPLSK